VLILGRCSEILHADFDCIFMRGSDLFHLIHIAVTSTQVRLFKRNMQNCDTFNGFQRSFTSCIFSLSPTPGWVCLLLSAPRLSRMAAAALSVLYLDGVVPEKKRDLVFERHRS